MQYIASVIFFFAAFVHVYRIISDCEPTKADMVNALCLTTYLGFYFFREAVL